MLGLRRCTDRMVSLTLAETEIQRKSGSEHKFYKSKFPRKFIRNYEFPWSNIPQCSVLHTKFEINFS